MSKKYDQGWYIPTTTQVDPSEIYSTEVTSPEFKELIVRLYQSFNNMALAINGKDTGIYDTEEFVTGQTFYPDPGLDSSSSTHPVQRPVFRKVVICGALPDNGPSPVAHGITVDVKTQFTRIYGVANDPVNNIYLPLPYVGATAVDSIEVFIDATNVNLVTQDDKRAYTLVNLVLEYIKT